MMKVQRNGAAAGLCAMIAAGLLGGCSEREDAGVSVSEQVVVAAATPLVVAEPVRAPVEAVVDAPVPQRSRGSVTYAEAEAVFRKGRYSEAAALLADFVDANAASGAGHYLLGLAAWKSGDHGGAEQALLRAVELDGSAKALTNLARVQLERGRASDALVHIETAVGLIPDSHEAWRVLGNVLSELGRRDDALDAYREALILNEHDAWTMNNYGLVLLRAGRYADALAPLARAVELAPGSALFHNNLGVALERSGYAGEARREYAAALAADSTSVKARTSLERVDAQLRGEPGDTIDLSPLSQAFADTVREWAMLAEHGC